jgi:hypothetical protein
MWTMRHKDIHNTDHAVDSDLLAQSDSARLKAKGQGHQCL